MAKTKRARRKARVSGPQKAAPTRWSVERAKARLSELMKRAREDGPQRITLYGQDAVVVVDASAFDALVAANSAVTMRDLIYQSPLQDLTIDRESFLDPVRPVDL